MLLEPDLAETEAAAERLRRVVEGSPIGKIMTDAHGTIVMVNAEAERLCGYRREEIIGKPIEILVPLRTCAAHLDFRDTFHAHPAVRAMGKGRDLNIVRKDGTQVPVEIGLNPIQMPEGTMVLSSIIDISDRKTAMQALAKRTEELQRSNADLEQFAYVASHDLQEPLRMVSCYTEMLAEHFKGRLDEKAETYVNYTIDGAKRAQQLVKDLLTYSHVDTQRKQPAPIEAETVVKRVLGDLKLAIEESHAQIFCGPLPTVQADEVQLAQVFQNLIGNALKFHGERTPQVHICAEQDEDKMAV